MLAHCFAAIKYILSPPYCVHCRKQLYKGFLCSECNGAIFPVVTKKLKITQKYRATIFAVSDYKDPLRSLVTAKKYRNRVASTQLGQLLWQKTDLCHQNFDIIVPVPLHWRRYAYRWYNQAEVMAQEIHKQTGKPLVQLLKRQRATGYQTRLNRQARLNNVKKAFVLAENAELYAGARILLVDDVMTTGTTITTCLKLLSRIRPKDLIVGVACRTI